jgi:hypothetical protein
VFWGGGQGPGFVVAGGQRHARVEKQRVPVHCELGALHLQILLALETVQKLLVVVIELGREALSERVADISVKSGSHVAPRLLETKQKEHQFAFALLAVLKVALQFLNTSVQSVHLGVLGQQLLL